MCLEDWVKSQKFCTEQPVFRKNLNVNLLNTKKINGDIFLSDLNCYITQQNEQTSSPLKNRSNSKFECAVFKFQLGNFIPTTTLKAKEMNDLRANVILF